MDVTIRIAGAAGQGIQTTATLLGKAATRAGLFAASFNDAESRIRGGLNFTLLRISDQPRPAYVERTDILISHSERAFKTYREILHANSIILIQEEGWGGQDTRIAPFTLSSLAKETGNLVISGIVAAAIIAALLKLDENILKDVVSEFFIAQGQKQELNLHALDIGFTAVEKWERRNLFGLVVRSSSMDKRLWLSGADAVALGAVAGGATFMASYPMSPSTGVIENLAKWADRTRMVVEQSEDEIAAINMASGASYAGARSLVATSGGGFDLMGEGISLIGMIETPVVIVLAQRPGPATGLPTRTAQGDLRLALHSGHGHFARVILAPRNVAEGFAMTARAFDLAEKFQAPIFVLTDQQLQDGQMTIDLFPTESLPKQRYYLTPEELEKLEIYRRFEPTASGISPMAAPGVSPHLVVVASDEHDPEGHLIESSEQAQAMAAKRLRKIQTVREELRMPFEIHGVVEDNMLVIGWGSTYEALAETQDHFSEMGKPFTHVHFSQLWPLPEETIAEIIDRAACVLVVENNPQGEFADLLQQVAVRKLARRINKLDGRPFSVEELMEKIDKEMAACKSARNTIVANRKSPGARGVETTPF